MTIRTLIRKEDNNTLYAKYEPLLHHLSHQCAGRCGRPEDEVFGQACWLFMQAASTRRDDKGKFGTYLYSVVRNGLADWGVENDLPPETHSTPAEPVTTITPSRSLEIKEWVEALSSECREVALMILNGPAEILEFGGGNLRKITARSVTRYLISRGWGWKRTRRTLRDLKEAVAAM